jgi:putative membrane protein
LFFGGIIGLWPAATMVAAKLANSITIVTAWPCRRAILGWFVGLEKMGVPAATDVERFFTEADRTAVENAVREAEKHTAGEIVPCAVSRSDHYEDAHWKGAVIGMLLGTLIGVGVQRALGFWGWSWFWMTLPMVGAGLLGFLLTLWSAPVRRLLVPAAVLDHHVKQRALAAFLEYEVFRTHDRTGILIFLSLFERRVLVLADSGISAHVGQHEWDGIVTDIVAGIRAGRPGPALAQAIGRCGELLARHGISARSHDVDELPDQLRTTEE